MKKGKYKKLSSVVGVHFGANRITAVEMRSNGSGPHVVSKGAIDVRPGFLNPAATENAAAIGAEVASLLRSMGATTKNAVFDIPAGYTSVRSYTFPKLPDEDLRAVVEGEVRHSRVLADSGGAFDFFKVGRPADSGEISVVAVAADDGILWYLADIAKSAKLQVVSRVPVNSAMLRSIVRFVPPERPTLYVTVSPGTTEIAIITPEGVQLYRRLDVRGADLVVQSARIEEIEKLEREAEGLLEEDVPIALRASRTGGKNLLDPVIVQRLLTEVRRSVEFLRRSHPEDAAVAGTVLGVTDEKWGDLQAALAESVGVPCQIATSDRVPGLDGSKSSDDYLTALGLASQPFAEDDDIVAPIDLMSSTRRTERVSTAQSGVSSAAVSAIVLGAALLISWFVLLFKGNAQSSTNDELQTQYEKLEAVYLPQQEAFRAEVEVISDLATKGIPFGPIMDDVSLSLDSDVGIMAATYDLGGRITLQGQAKSEEAIVSTLGKLRMIGGFNQTFVDSFEVRRDKGLVFNISTNYDLTYPARRAAEHEAQGLGAGPMEGEKKMLDQVVTQ